MNKQKTRVIFIAIIITLGIGGYFTFNMYNNFKNAQNKITQNKSYEKQKNLEEKLNTRKQEITQKYQNIVKDIKNKNKSTNSTNDAFVGGGFEKEPMVQIKGYKNYENEKYGDLDDNNFSLYVHKNSNKPLIISVHGGAFMIGSKDMEYSSLEKFYQKGYNVMAINYTLSNSKVFPQALYDVKEAVKYIKVNLKKYGLTNDKIILKGESAGGNLVSLAALSESSNKLINSKTKFKNVDANVLGVIDQYGPIDFLNVSKELKEVNITPKMGVPTDSNSPESKYLGEQVSKNSKQTKLTNPQNYINDKMPKIFIQAGYKDNMVGVLQSVNFAKNIELKLPNIQNLVTTTFFENAGHGGLEFDNSKNIDLLSNWIEKISK